MITLFLVRHGETAHNLNGRIQGQSDSPLTDLGKAQAEAIGRRLASEKFDAAYTSDLGRARNTAEIIMSHQKNPIELIDTSLLRERCFGVLQGLTAEEIEEKYPADLHEWRRPPHYSLVGPPGAETRLQVLERCGSFVDEIVQKHPDESRILVVGHGGSIRGVLMAACKFPDSFSGVWHLSNAGLSIVRVGEYASIWLVNDTCHLSSVRVTDVDADNAVK